jgi:hypothetical protein
MLVFLIFICFIPFFVLGFDFALSFWRSNWFLVLFLGLILCGIDLFYFFNKRLFSFLEREDWPALINYLEDEVFRKGRYSSRNIRLLANTYLILSDSGAVMTLENRTAAVKPALVEANVLVFGIARILGKDFAGAARFFESRRETARPETRLWIRWYYGFSLLLERRFPEAADEFTLLARESADALITGLSAFFLADILGKRVPEKKAVLTLAASQGQSRVRKYLPGPGDWRKERGNIRTEIHAAVLSTYLDEAGSWIYGTGKPEGKQ